MSKNEGAGIKLAVEQQGHARPETAEEMAKRLTEEVEKYKEMVSDIKTEAELDKLEAEIIAEMKKYDEYLKGVKYKLPLNCLFEDKTYTKSDVAGKIIYFISKNEQTWQYIPGLYELCKLWKNPNFERISYGELDSTLRLLDQQKYAGMNEWRDILIINEYMKGVHEGYAKDISYQIALAHKHNAIIKQRDLINPVTPKEKPSTAEE
jgi:hypothetical protein